MKIKLKKKKPSREIKVSFQVMYNAASMS